MLDDLRRRILALVLAATAAGAGFLGVEQLNAIDSSYDLLTYQEAVQLRQRGAVLYIQALTAYPSSGLEQPRYRVESLRNAHNAGLLIAGYVLVGDRRYSGAESVDFARQGIPDDLWDALVFTAIDIETAGYPYSQALTALDRTQALGKGRVIYTSCHVWLDILHGPPAPPDTLLWEAWWDGDPDIDFAGRSGRCRNFGGWTDEQILGKQFSGGVYVDGQYVDQNTIRFPVLATATPAIPGSTPSSPGSTAVATPGVTEIPAPPGLREEIDQLERRLSGVENLLTRRFSPDGRSCDEVRGTPYRSRAERPWYFEVCLGKVAP